MKDTCRYIYLWKHEDTGIFTLTLMGAAKETRSWNLSLEQS